MKSNLSSIDQEAYQKLLEVDPSFAETYLKEHSKQFITKSKSEIPWPLKNKWYYHKRFNDVKKRFKFLEAILIEIGNSIYRLTRNECKKLIFNDKLTKNHSFILNGKRKTPAFMELNCKTLIAKKVGCSVRTVEYMLRALVRIKALRVHNLGKGKSYYSCGYWSKYKNKKEVIDFKVYMYMNQNIAKSLTDQNKFYKRKPKI